MKKLLYCAVALAGLFAASCQQESLEPVQETGAVTFTVEAPAAMQTKAIADGTNVEHLIYEVWLTPTLGSLEGAQRLYQNNTATLDLVDGVRKTKVTLDLVNDQKFAVLFWAQVDDPTSSDRAYNTDQLTAVTYAQSEYNSNDESLAAFYAVAYVVDGSHVKKDGTGTTGAVKLTRPFAQLNLGTLNTSTEYTVDLVNSEVTVYQANTTFNVATSVASAPNDLTFKMAAVPSDPATLTVNEKAYEYAGMNYLFAGTSNTVSYKILTQIGGGMNGTVENRIDYVPLQENYRTNIIGNLLTSRTDYDIVVDAAFAGDINRDGQTTYVTNDEEFAAALKADKGDIVIDLAGDPVVKSSTTPKTYSVAIGAWTEKYYFGGSATRTITINANGNKINFVHEDGDWNYIRCVNEAAKWIINDAVLTNSGANNGPWNRHDIRFYNAVELNNVTSDKAIALLNDGKLTNVAISDVHPDNSEAYGLWITAQGQTVSLDGVTITPSSNKTTDRAIKIADEYTDAPAKVTLNVENSTFVSQKKAAVLVTSTAGATINWGAGNNITGVVADPINAVWVDEDRAQYFDLVEVTGADVILEGSAHIVTVKTAEELQKAADEAKSDKITMIAIAKDIEGNVTVSQKPDVKIVINGDNHSYKGVVIVDGKSGTYTTAGLTIKNLIFDAADIENDACVNLGDGTNSTRYTCNVTLDNCTFDVPGAVGVKSYTGGDKSLTITGSTATANAHSLVQAKGIDGILVEKCNVYSKNGLNFNNSNNVVVDGCTVDVKGYAVRFGESSGGAGAAEKYTIKNSTLKSACEEGDAVVILRGTADYATLSIEKTTLEGSIQITNTAKDATVTIDGKYYVSSQDSLEAAIAEGAKAISLMDGNYTMPKPDLRGKELTITGSKDVVIDASAVDARDQFVTGATLKFEGVTLNFGKVNYMGFANTASLIYKDCNINGLQFLFGENVSFEGCSLNSNGAEHTVWTYGAEIVNFKDCHFTYGDRGVNCYSDNDVKGGKQTVNFTNCTFATENTRSEGAVEINSTFFSVGIEVNMEDCTAPAYGQMAYVSPWDSSNGAKTTINIK